ncbi:enoyl-CoA hydratase-related protein [Polymorphobacter sp.]|uniref:enoyl-CoA hydratase-related protein n=1 Tax=Polymorphobacter sp. TaxID=1909290 RepID=UPI003F71B746
MAYEFIQFDEAEGVATLTLNRPAQLNAMHTPMVAEMIQALDRVRDERTSRCLLVTGAGRAFSSGADLAGGELSAGDGPPDTGKVLESHFNPLLERLMALPVPVVCAINGAAAGAGCSIALAGDIVLAGRSAYLLQAFINIGLVPDVGATWMLPRLAGKARATAMMMLGERIKADQALDWGLVYKVVDDEALATEARAVAIKLAQGPTRAHALIRQGIRACLDSTLGDALRLERAHQREAGRTQDFAEGVQAFLDKRPARFEGK